MSSLAFERGSEWVFHLTDSFPTLCLWTWLISVFTITDKVIKNKDSKPALKRGRKFQYLKFGQEVTSHSLKAQMQIS